MQDSNVPIHFAFPDGLLKYDCDSCHQPCCKTGGLVVFPAERERIIHHHPALELVSPAVPDNIAIFQTPPSGCWFLADDKCSLHGSAPDPDATRPDKPAACNLFPFNLFGMLDNALIVGPNPLCPLTIEPGEGVWHSQVLGLLQQYGAAGDPPSELRPDAPADILTLERVIRDAGRASIAGDDPLELLAFTELATRAFTEHGVDGLQAAQEAGLPELPAVLEETRQTFARLSALLAIPIPDRAAMARIAPLLAAWIPTLRLFAFTDIPVSALPRAFVALTLYLGHWAALAPHRPLLPRALSEMLSSLTDVITVLTLADISASANETDQLGPEAGSFNLEASLTQLPPDAAIRGAALRNHAQTLGLAPVGTSGGTRMGDL